jgi:hypothetical protein
MRSGDGVNDYLLLVARHVRHEARSAVDAKEIIRPYLQQARAERSAFDIERELNRQVETSYAGFVKGADVSLTNPFKPKPKAPAVNPEAVEVFTKEGPGVYDLWERSPIRFDDAEHHTEEVIDGLFAANEYLSVGFDKNHVTHETREELRGRLHKFSFIVPAPMHMEGGTTQEGRLSFRCRDAVKVRRYVVAEFDKLKERDKQASLIWHLRSFLPLMLVLDSAGKSLHAWFYCEGLDESEGGRLNRFIRHAISLGADPAGLRLGQYVRMPDGTRRANGIFEENKRQTVIFFNPGGIRQ